jgi:hypothetical protein
MRSAFIVVLLTLVSFGCEAQGGSLKADGRMWENFDNASIKAAYVQGAIEGLRAGAAHGYSRGRLDEKIEALNYVKQCVQKGPCAAVPIASMIKADSSNEVVAGIDKVVSDVSPQHASVFDIVHQMDKFYGNYKNTPVCMIVAVQESIASLKGTSSTEQDLELMREQGCNH